MKRSGPELEASHRKDNFGHKGDREALASARWFIGLRPVQKIVKRGAERARIPQHVTPRVLKASVRHKGTAARHLAGRPTEDSRSSRLEILD